jgi:hypothetical protein
MGFLNTIQFHFRSGKLTDENQKNLRIGSPDKYILEKYIESE